MQLKTKRILVLTLFLVCMAAFAFSAALPNCNFKRPAGGGSGVIDGGNEDKKDSGYYEECLHEKSGWEIVQYPSCTESGIEEHWCYNCGRKIDEREIPALGHDFEDGICTRCGAGIYDDCKHTSVTDWIVEKASTCTEKGTKYKQCAVCGVKTDMASIPKAEHTASDWVVDKEPTCTAAGSRHNECTVCSEKLKTETINSLGHDYKNDVCTRCGVGKYDDCEHTSVTGWIIDVNATCTTAGSKHKQCTVCKTVTETAIIPATGHVASDWVIEKEASCTVAGSKYNYCTVCSEKLKTESISALGHNYVGGVCTHCGAKENVSDETYTREGNYIYFGSYPQTKVSDSATLNALNGYKGTLPTSSNNQSWTDCEYYIEGRNTTAFMWYKDVTYSGNKYRAVYFTSYRPYFCSCESSTSYTYQNSNGYNKGTVYWFKYEPIKWRILTESNDSAFLMSEIAIDSQQYYHTSGTRTVNGKTVYPNNYAESEIRAWLNETFYNTAFSTLQQSLIKTTLVDNSAASTNLYNNPTAWNNGVNSYACENTNDKIFLLSEKEVTNSAYGFSGGCFEYDTKRQLKSTDYAKSQGCNSSAASGYLGNCWWWRRSPCYYNSCCARGVFYRGGADSSLNVDGTSSGVVPALWLNLYEAPQSDTYTREGNYIYFGSYPQTKVTDSSTLNALSGYTGTLPTSSNNQSWTDCEYYIEGRNTTAFMWYKDVTYSGNKYRAVYFTSYRPVSCGSISSASNSNQDDNGYNTGTVYWFKYEPIKWRILTEKNGSAFLMSEIAIDSQQYYNTDDEIKRAINGKTVYENNYAESDIRAWLNEEFYNTAFDSAQKSLIKTTLVDNSAASINSYNNPTKWNDGVNEYACENTNDKIFLLSEKEATNNSYGFSSSTGESATRQLKSTDYAKSQGCIQRTDSSYLGNCFWWLRSPYYNYSYYASLVGHSGSAADISRVDDTMGGVVPALWLTL